VAVEAAEEERDSELVDCVGRDIVVVVGARTLRLRHRKRKICWRNVTVRRWRPDGRLTFVQAHAERREKNTVLSSALNRAFARDLTSLLMRLLSNTCIYYSRY
jgi:hypothetical protein